MKSYLACKGKANCLFLKIQQIQRGIVKQMGRCLLSKTHHISIFRFSDPYDIFSLASRLRRTVLTLHHTCSFCFQQPKLNDVDNVSFHGEAAEVFMNLNMNWQKCFDETGLSAYLMNVCSLLLKLKTLSLGQI